MNANDQYAPPPQPPTAAGPSTPAPLPPPPQPTTADRRGGPYVNDPRRKSVLWACLLSALPGLGQVYVGYYHVGFRNILVIAFMLVLANSRLPDHIEPAVVMFMAFFWLHNVVDAGRRASLYNQALDGLRPMDLPEDMKQPPQFGSFAWGVGLVVVGLVFFSNTMFGLSLEWVGRIWPLALIGIGGWLIYADRRGKGE
ncbi:MAG: hypothetical protein AB1806_03240 [Acidobacteriota bacterium]